MSFSLYDLTVPVFTRAFANLSTLLAKGDAFAAEGGIPAETLLQTRLAPDMGTLAFQVQRASDTAKGTAVRLGGIENLRLDDNEASFADLQQRIAKTVAFLGTVTPAQLDGREDESVIFKAGPRTMEYTGRSYVLEFALPNFFFHITTAYALLRHKGVPIGKADYLGW